MSVVTTPLEPLCFELPSKVKYFLHMLHLYTWQNEGAVYSDVPVKINNNFKNSKHSLIQSKKYYYFN